MHIYITHYSFAALHVGPTARRTYHLCMHGNQYMYICTNIIHIYCVYIDRKNPPFPIYCALSSRTVSKRTPLEEFVPGASRGVLLPTVLDEET